MKKILDLLRLISFIVNHPLNAKRKIASIWRFLLWQIGSRLVPGPVAVDLTDDAKLLVSPGMTGATGNVYTGLHEFEDMAFVLHALREGDVFVDVGANIGSYTILAGAIAKARCVSFEPIPTTFRHLLQNVNLNGIADRVDAMNIGVGSENGELQFTSELDTVNHVVDINDNNVTSVSVPIRSLNDVLENAKPTIIKIDVEGFETNVIKGASLILSQNHAIAVIMELNGSGDRYGFDESYIQEQMLEYGFKTFAYSPFTRELIPIEGKNSNSGNTIYAKDAEYFQRRLQSALPFRVNGHSI